MKFIGRKNEMAKLGAEYKRDSSFVVIYGRRRVGKTTLIKEFLKDKTAFYFLATEEIESQSMKRLAGVVARTTQNNLLQKAVFMVAERHKYGWHRCHLQIFMPFRIFLLQMQWNNTQ